MDIAICIATHRRPRLLQQLLTGLDKLTFTRIPMPGIRLIVIDNDASGSAESVCDAAPTRWPLVYRIEARRGIAQARNRALLEIGEADFIAFIDDDETPSPEWLEELLLAQAHFGADVVSGPVLPLLPTFAPAWMSQGGFFNSPPFPTGQLLDSCATNNTLLTRDVLQKVPRFDEQFQLSGADDLHFFRRAYRAGLKLVWCNEATVSEAITADRATFRWLMRRAFRGGNGAVLVESALDQRLSTRVLRFLKASTRIAQGAFGALLALVRGRVHLARSLGRMSLGAGMLAGLCAWTYQSHQATTGE